MATAPLNPNFKEGTVLLIDKPLEWTSFDVVNKVRYAIKKKLGVKKIKVGHAGTLDPLATGLLILCTGKFTKKINDYQALYKEYTGTMHLGATTPSYDGETAIDEHFDTEHLTMDMLKGNLQYFQGEIEQYPPIFSAVKVDGQPLYKKARKGEKPTVKARQVTIYNFELTGGEMPHIDFRVRCSKGTYIRSLVHDFGQKLDNGAYLTKLCRTKIGEHSLENAWDLEELIEAIKAI